VNSVTTVFFYFLPEGVESGRGDIDTEFSDTNFLTNYNNYFANGNSMVAR
jgi:hypothetical protein